MEEARFNLSFLFEKFSIAKIIKIRPFKVFRPWGFFFLHEFSLRVSSFIEKDSYPSKFLL
jgi:hypothetical protein